jgi:uncharacterized protein
MERTRAVYAACQEGDVEALQRWFPDGPTEWRDSTGHSLLHWVVQTPHVSVLDWLQTFSFNVDVRTDGRSTPLMGACCCGQKVMVRWLLAQGADLRATDCLGRTALHYACMYRWVDGAAWLLEQGADPEARDDEDLLPEDHWSVSSPHHATFCDLLDAARHGCGLK